MFSRFHHRRAPSTPTSPVPDQLAPWEVAALQEKQLQQQQQQQQNQLYQHQNVQHQQLRPTSSSSTSANTTSSSMAANMAPAMTTTTLNLSTTLNTSANTTSSSSSSQMAQMGRVTSAMTVASDRSYEYAHSTSSGAPSVSYSAPPTAMDTRRPPTRPAAVPTSPRAQQKTSGTSAGPKETSFIGGVALANLRRSGGVHGPDLSMAAAAAATKTAAAGRPSASAAPMSPTSPSRPAPGTSATMSGRNAPTSPQMYSPPDKRSATRTKQHLPPPPANTSGTMSPRQAAMGDMRPLKQTMSSFVTPTDLQTTSAAAAAASAAIAANDAHNAARTKKGLPFLKKNPMSSLLSRRKTAQSDMSGYSPDGVDGPVYAPIRGTRVHDFSAPRPRHVVSNDLPLSSAAVATAAAVAAAAAASSAASNTSASNSAVASPTAAFSPTSEVPSRPHSKDPPTMHRHHHQQPPQRQQQPQSASYASSRNSSIAPDPAQDRDLPTAPVQATDPRASMQMPPPPLPEPKTLQTLQENRQISFDDKPLPERPMTQDSPRGSTDVSGPPASIRAGSTRSRATSADVTSLLKSSSSATTRSRNMSLSDFSPNPATPGTGMPSTSVSTPASATSVMPKPMKSTSSRFSFMVGSASEEKLLEERHRQKQMEKRSSGLDEADSSATGPRDSRFDDFDEDGFDYDAMMDDDGLEERIPGVNADADDDEYGFAPYEEPVPEVGFDDDYENEEPVPEVGLDDYEKELPAEATAPEDDDPDGLDPNNDQENFAGFVFQRSNPASAMVTPSIGTMPATPRDASGETIGFAVTKDTPTDATASHRLSRDVAHTNQETKRATIAYGDFSLASATDVLGIRGTATAGRPKSGIIDSTRGMYGMQTMEDMQRIQENLKQLHVHEYHETVLSEEPPKPQQKKRQRHDLSGTNQPRIPSMVFPPAIREDDLYFDQGLSDELDFGQPQSSTVPFDESIFDNNDTDEYGRPIPGAFAKAQAQRALRASAEISSIKRESDIPSSHHSDHSQPAASTAHTSMSASGLPYGVFPVEKNNHTDESSERALSGEWGSSGVTAGAFVAAPRNTFAPAHKEDSLTALRRQLPPIMTDAERVAAYQAALADAAYQAQASGKFRRDSSPTSVSSDFASIGAGLSQQGFGDSVSSSAIEASPTAVALVALGGVSTSDGIMQRAYSFDNKEDQINSYGHNDNDGFTQDMDDYDFDDDAIIAEANAEALANDQDGFYGQEFNFYSSPLHNNGHGNGGSSSAAAQVEFSNGGYFVPTGVGRSTSGRVVSREPNLTPITERSEYSNRNSVLSMGLPPLGSSADLRPPGLAQLAMLTGDDSDMSLSALMRLRNKTFGGSQASLLSSREGSPRTSSAAGMDRDRDSRDREGATSPWGLPAFSGGSGNTGFLHQHARRNSANSFSMRAGSGRGSETGSDSGSPTMTSNFATFPPIIAHSPVSPGQFDGGVNPACPPVLEEEDETGDDNDQTNSSSLAGSGLWMRSSGAFSGISGTSNISRLSSGSDYGYASASALQQLTQSNMMMVASPTTMASMPPISTTPITSPIQTTLSQTQSPSSSTAMSPTTSMAPPSLPPITSRRGMGHRHKSSADSISYTMEEDSGETRWVMERRRLAETGEMEILEREVVEGGRI